LRTLHRGGDRKEDVVIVRHVGKWIEIQSGVLERDKIRSIPGVRWDALTRSWKCPATPGFLGRVLEVAERTDTVDCTDLRCALQQREESHRLASSATVDRCDFLKTPPREHQIGAIDFGTLSDAAMYHMHMSAGKTFVALAICAARSHKSILVLCPKAVIRVWDKEVKKHGPHGTHVLTLDDGSVAERDRRLRRALATLRGPILAVANYEAAWHEPLSKTILQTPWDCLILDESSRIKSPGGKASRFCALIPARQRLALTGTPMPHSPLDIYAQYRALDPGIFGTSFQAFKAKYAIMGGYQNYQVVGWRNGDDLKRRMDSIRYEVKAEDLDLPTLDVVDVPVALGAQARQHYRELENLFITNVKSGAVTASNALAKLLRLQQVTCGFLPVQGINGETLRLEEISTEKRDALTELLEEAGHEPVVVFCRFKHDLAATRQAAEGLGRRSGELSGDRNDMAAWDAGEVDVMAVQVQAGGMGIDLTRARYGIYFSMVFSLGEYDQSLARLCRTNQTRPVTIYRLTAEKTVDEKICKVLDAKREVIEAILTDARTPAADE